VSVYVAMTPDNEFLKVGFTTQTWERRNRYVGLRLLGFVPGTLKDESDLCRRLGRPAKGDEWFTPSPSRISTAQYWLAKRGAA
jgi:hypothetical protein